MHLIFSKIPLGEHLAYASQKYITKSLPISDEKFVSAASIAKEHLDAFKEYGCRPLNEARFFEFGAGWDLVVPLTFYAFGVERQILVDLRNLLRKDLVNDIIGKFYKIKFELAFSRKPAKCFHESTSSFLVSLNSNYGIDYRAPCDARDTGLEDGSIDCMSSTNTLEHIPKEDIRLILKESHRLLHSEGILTFRIDYQDHYSYFDKGISVYNFLQFSDKDWERFNPDLHFQNRLRHRDYRAMFNEEGFEVIAEKCTEGTEVDLKTLKNIPLAECFRGYDLLELAIRNSHMVFRKKR